jgi:hypothetical protein
MRRRIAVVVFLLGTIAGYGSAFAHVMHAHGSECHRSQTPSSK